MGVWDESAERRSEVPRPDRIRRFYDWKDALLYVAQLAGLATVGGSCAILILSSLGFTFSGSGQAIAEIRAANVVQDTSIARLKASQEPVMYMVCVLFAESHPRQVPRACDQSVRESTGR